VEAITHEPAFAALLNQWGTPLASHSSLAHALVVDESLCYRLACVEHRHGDAG
jgi:hypothetical protein